MPRTLPSGTSESSSISNDPKPKDSSLIRKYRSAYPEGLNFTPGKKLHDRIKSEIIRRARESEDALKKRWPSWDRIDKTLTAFVDLSSAEKNIRQQDERVPISIVVPESFASLETYLTFMAAVFGERPTWRMEGAGPEDIVGAILLEKVVDLQAMRSHLLLTLMKQWRDGFAYGFGAVQAGWDVRFGKKTVVERIIATDPIDGEPFIEGFEKRRVDAILYEGMQIISIDVRRYLPDPTVPIYEPNRGEYVSWVEETNFPTLFGDENSPDSLLFNVLWLRKHKGQRSAIYSPGDTNAREAEGSFINSDDSTLSNVPADVIWMYINLIPNDWDMGTSKVHERWLFGLANDEILIAAHPMDLNHNTFPVTVCAPDAGGHEFMPPSRLEILSGYQTFANYLLNAHIISTDKMMKNRILVDPKLVNMNDVKANKSYIRTRPSVWGRGVQGAMEQVKLSDVTANHMSDLSAVIQLARQHGGAQDALLGVQRQRGERVTKAEFEATRGSALSRLQRLAQIISMQSMLPLGALVTSHTQQFMSEEVYIQTIGQTEEALKQEYGIDSDRISVSPFDININFDIIMNDASVLSTESADSWIAWLQVVLQVPEIAFKTLDLPRINLHIARLMGNKSPEQFMLKKNPGEVTFENDEAVRDQAEKGNIVPIEEAVSAFQ